MNYASHVKETFQNRLGPCRPVCKALLGSVHREFAPNLQKRVLVRFDDEKNHLVKLEKRTFRKVIAPGLQLSCERASLCRERWLTLEAAGECACSSPGFEECPYMCEFSAGWVEMHADAFGEVEPPNTGIWRTGPAYAQPPSDSMALVLQNRNISFTEVVVTESVSGGLPRTPGQALVCPGPTSAPANAY